MIDLIPNELDEYITVKLVSTENDVKETVVSILEIDTVN